MSSKEDDSRSSRNKVERTTSVANKKARRSSKEDDSGTNNKKEKEMVGKILKVMFQCHMEERFDITIEDVANQVGVHERTRSFRETWSSLRKANLIGPSSKKSCLRLTEEGLKEAATPEYKEMMKELSIKPKTNKEHQERIKKFLQKSKAAEMYDLFHKYGSLTKDDLSALIGQNKRSHGYHYSFNELKAKHYIEEDPDSKDNKMNKFRLSDKCFLNPKEDRPKECGGIVAKECAVNLAKGLALIESRKKNKSKGIKKEAVKEENIDGVKDEAMEAVKEENIDGVKDEAMESEIEDGIKKESESSDESKNVEKDGLNVKSSKKDFEEGDKDKVDTETKTSKSMTLVATLAYKHYLDTTKIDCKGKDKAIEKEEGTVITNGPIEVANPHLTSDISVDCDSGSDIDIGIDNKTAETMKIEEDKSEKNHNTKRKANAIKKEKVEASFSFYQ